MRKLMMAVLLCIPGIVQAPPKPVTWVEKMMAERYPRWHEYPLDTQQTLILMYKRSNNKAAWLIYPKE